METLEKENADVLVRKVTGSFFINKVGSENYMNLIKEHFKEYNDSYLSFKSIRCIESSIYRFNFNVIDDELKEKIKNVEATLNKEDQKLILETVVQEFLDEYKDYMLSNIKEVCAELNISDDVKFVSNLFLYTTFSYKKSSGMLSLDIIC